MEANNLVLKDVFLSKQEIFDSVRKVLNGTLW